MNVGTRLVTIVITKQFAVTLTGYVLFKHEI